MAERVTDAAIAVACEENGLSGGRAERSFPGILSIVVGAGDGMIAVDIHEASMISSVDPMRGFILPAIEAIAMRLAAREREHGR